MKIVLNIPKGWWVWEVKGLLYGTRKKVSALIVAPPPEEGGKGKAKATFVEQMLEQRYEVNPVTLTAQRAHIGDDGSS